MPDRSAVATSVTEMMRCEQGQTYQKEYELDTSQIAPGEYQIQIVAFEPTGVGRQIRHDYVPHAVSFTVYTNNQLDNFEWNSRAWGDHVIPNIREVS